MRFLAIGLCLALTWAGAATPPPGPLAATRIALRSMGVEEGLPNARVHAVLRDRHGRLWVGTEEGAAWLAGGGWTPLPLPAGAPSNYVRAIAETRDGALWFGTEAGGLWRWKDRTWRHWGVGSGLPVNRVNALLAEGDLVWVGTAGAGLWRIRDGVAAQVAGPADRWVWTLARVPGAGGRAELWVGGQDHVWVQGEEGWRSLDEREGWWKGGANAIVLRGQEVWVSSWGHGVGIWDPAGRRFQGPLPDFPSRNPTSLAVVRRPDGGEDLWAGTYDAGLFRRTADGWDPLGPEQGFPSAGVYCILNNPEGRPSLWVGTRGSGLVSVDPAGWRTLPDDPRIPGSQANCFLETLDPQGGRTFWIGTDKGLLRWDRGGPTLETRAHGLPGDFVTGLLEVPAQGGTELWASTLGGLARRRGGRWEAFGKAQGLNVHRVQCLAADLDEEGRPRLYAGADGGLLVHQGGAWTVHATAQGLPHAIVTSLLADRDRDGAACLWVGTRGGGVGRFKRGQWQVFGTGEGLPNLSVYGLAATRSASGRRWLWAGLLGGRGLARLDLDRPEAGFSSWGPRELPGLGGRGVQGIVRGLGENLYLTTTGGVLRLHLNGPDQDPGEVVAYTPSDGLPSSAASAATYLDRDGRVWVGTARGVAVLDPGAERDLPPPPPPLLESVQVDGRELDPGAPVRLGFRDRRLAVHFGLPVFHRHEAVRYRTQLIGFDPEPGDWDARAEVVFTPLPARSYTLRVWARDGMGRVAPPLDLPIRVDPAPWFTWWALALEGGLVLGLAYLGAARRHRVLERRTRELEGLVAERTRDLAGAVEALRTQSLTDPLTGILNRRGLDESMGELVNRYQRRLGEPGAGERNRDLGFLVLDLDHFKSVNDAHGHRAGDRVLQQTAAVLRQAVRESDRIVRWGGEEFVVVAVDTSTEEVPVLAERLRAAVAGHPFAVEGGPVLDLTVSIGFATLPLFPDAPLSPSWEVVVNLADQCLYQAKVGGRNRWVGLVPRPGAAAPAEPSALEAEGLAGAGLVDLRRGPEPV